MRASLPFSVPDSTIVGQERRREIRYPVSGAVEFELMDCYDDQPYNGELVEVSASGMRMRHGCARLERDMRIRFRHPKGTGVARAVWNRRSGRSLESGFEFES